MLNRYFCAYTIGENAYSEFNTVCQKLGTRFLLIGGETALKVSADKFLSNVDLKTFEMVDKVIYGKECYYERVCELYEKYKSKSIDFVVGAGGGKALDTSKYLAKLLGVEVVTLPTIASTCAASSALSVIYTKDHAFERFEYYIKPAFHCFIDTTIISHAPHKFIRAGLGDTLAKHYEVEFSSRGKELDYSTQLGLSISKMCAEPVMKYGKKALEAAVNKTVSNEFEQIVLAIIITTGTVSMLVNPDYNGAMAHALFYGLTVIHGFEERFLHGDVVGYCTAVQLAVDNNMEEAIKIIDFIKSIGVEATLCERGIPLDRKYLDNALKSAINDPDMKVIPYRVSCDMLFEGLKAIEELG